MGELTEIEKILAGDRAAFKELYQKCFMKIKMIVTQYGGSEADAQDHFQDCAMTLIDKLRKGEFKGESQLSTYFIGIAKLKWMENTRKNIRRDEVKKQVKEHVKDIDYMQEVENIEDISDIIKSQLSKISDDCKDILKMFYFLKLSMEEISKLKGFTIKSIRVTKFRCMDKLRKNIMSNPTVKNQLSYAISQ